MTQVVPDKALHWPPVVIVAGLVFRATQAPITGAAELKRYM
jgi:hypothetical protein